MVALEEQVGVGRSRWKAGAGRGGRGRVATRPGTDMAEQGSDGACYKGAGGKRVALGPRVRAREDSAEEAVSGPL